MARRLQKELKDFEDKKDELDWVAISTVGDDIMHWTALISGPEDSLYANGSFTVDISFPTEYPFRAPKLKFVTKICHPNIKQDTGEICADVISSNWKPMNNVLYCLNVIRTMMQEPLASLDNPLEPDLAAMARDDREKFDKTVRDAVAKYAT